MSACVKIWNIVSTLLVVLAILLALCLVGVRIFGVQTYTVLSGFMEPEHHVGSLIYVVEAEPDSIEVGDSISFLLDKDIIATHQVVEVVPASDSSDIGFGQRALRMTLLTGV